MPTRDASKLGTLPSAGLAVAGSLVICALALYAILALLRPHPEGARDLKCAMQIRQVAQGLLQYAADHDGTLPAADEDWAAILIQSDPAMRDMLLSPATWEPDRSSYTYVPAASLDPTGQRVLLYEIGGLHGDKGMHIAYHDGRVEIIPTTDAEKTIASLDLSQGQPSRPRLSAD